MLAWVWRPGRWGVGVGFGVSCFGDGFGLGVLVSGLVSRILGWFRVQGLSFWDWVWCLEFWYRA